MKFQMLSYLVIALCLSTGVYAGPGDGPKKPSAQHTYYRHALTQLRSARWLIDNKPGNWQESVQEVEAVTRIDAAIAAIKRAAIDDGRPLGYRPRIKSEPTEHNGRLRSAVAYLKKARVYVGQDKDKALVQNLQLRAYEQIDGAIKALRKAIHPDA